MHRSKTQVLPLGFRIIGKNIESDTHGCNRCLNSEKFRFQESCSVVFEGRYKD